MRIIAPLLLAFCGAFGPARADPDAVTVFAAASLGGVLEEIAAGFGPKVTLSFGGSGTMARQVAAGAPADAVVLASPDWMDWLKDQGAVMAGSEVAVAANALVVIGAAGAPPLADPADLPGRLADGRLAMGQRDAVPAGSYGRDWLRDAGLWDAVEPVLAETDNVRAALMLVARGDAPLGIVYATDAAADPRVAIVYTVPDDATEPILYPAAAVTPRGAAFVAYLQTPAAQAVFAAHGFRPVPE